MSEWRWRVMIKYIIFAVAWNFSEVWGLETRKVCFEIIVNRTRVYTLQRENTVDRAQPPRAVYKPWLPLPVPKYYTVVVYCKTNVSIGLCAAATCGIQIMVTAADT